MNNGETKGEQGDGLGCFVFCHRGWDSVEKGEDYDLHFVASILSFQRQFYGCMSDHSLHFEGDLLGQSRDDRDSDDDDDDDGDDRAPQDFDMDTVSHAFNIPQLNQSQLQAASNFLGLGVSIKNDIQVVQG